MICTRKCALNTAIISTNRWRVIGLFYLMMLAFSPTDATVYAQEPTDAVANVQAKMKKQLISAKSDFARALDRDPKAMERVFKAYLLQPIIALAVFIVGYMLASFLGRLVGQSVANRVDVTLGRFLGRMTTNAIMLLIALGVLGYFGVDVTSFAAIIAAGGFAIGMALQGTLGNFAAGVMLLVFRPFRVHDYIKVSGIEGVVEEIDLFTTKLNTLDNRHMIVPNSQIFGSVIENYTRNDVRRVNVDVGVAYRADMRQTRQVLAKAISVIPGGLTQPEPEVYLVDLGESSVNWQLRVWCRPANYWDVRQRMTIAAKDALDAAQIGIPFPQLDLHVVGGTPAFADAGGGSEARSSHDSSLFGRSPGSVRSA